jgi:hypothetical protein
VWTDAALDRRPVAGLCLKKEYHRARIVVSAAPARRGALDPRRFLDELHATGSGAEAAAALPLLCAGGIGDEAGFAAALADGYAGAQVHTAERLVRAALTGRSCLGHHHQHLLCCVGACDDCGWSNLDRRRARFQTPVLFFCAPSLHHDQVGTRFLATDECIVPDEYKRALVGASEVRYDALCEQMHPAC